MEWFLSKKMHMNLIVYLHNGIKEFFANGWIWSGSLRQQDYLAVSETPTSEGECSATCVYTKNTVR